MTVKLLDEIKRFQGLSTDTKPTGVDVVVGSMFFEEDTGQSFLYTGSSWVCDPTNPGLASSLNSHNVWLGSNITFTGTAEDITNIAVIIVTVFADEASATDGLSVEFSHDGINWDNKDVFTIPANTGKTFSFQPSGSWYRVVYTNGPIFQGIFRLNSYLKTTYVKPSSHRIQDGISGQDDAELVKAIVTGEDSSAPGTFINVKTTAGGNMRVSVDQVETTTNSIKTISYSHAELHSGDHYFARSWEELAIAGVKDLLLVTPNTTRLAHMIIGVENEVAATYDLYEGTTTSADGTRDNERNRNREYADDNTTFIYEDPTVTGVGALIASSSLGSGKKFGGGSRDTEELILQHNVKYLLRITNVAAGSTNIINWLFDWYEHTNIV